MHIDRNRKNATGKIRLHRAAGRKHCLLESKGVRQRPPHFTWQVFLQNTGAGNGKDIIYLLERGSSNQLEHELFIFKG